MWEVNSWVLEWCKVCVYAGRVIRVGSTDCDCCAVGYKEGLCLSELDDLCVCIRIW